MHFDAISMATSELQRTNSIFVFNMVMGLVKAYLKFHCQSVLPFFFFFFKRTGFVQYENLTLLSFVHPFNNLHVPLPGLQVSFEFFGGPPTLSRF